MTRATWRARWRATRTSTHRACRICCTPRRTRSSARRGAACRTIRPHRAGRSTRRLRTIRSPESMRWLAAAALLLLVASPDDSRQAAIGPRGGLPPPLARALDPAAFVPLGKPGPNDWLASHPERGQTFREFEHAGVNRPDAQRHTIYFQPLGRFGTDAPSLELLRKYAAAFFMLDVKLLAPIPLDAKITSRTNP